MNEEHLNRRTRVASKQFARSVKLYCLVFFMVGFPLYCYFSFPQQFQHLQPEQFDSHPVSDYDQQVRDLKAMKPRVFRDQLVSICEDIQVDSNEMVYCINQKRQIVQLYTKRSISLDRYTIEKGETYGLRLSKDQKFLYFVNSELGFCEFNLQKRKMKQLIHEYQGQSLISLNGIEINPQNPDIIYLTQSSTVIPLERFSIDSLMNNPLGRVFEFNKKTQQLRLLADGLYFPNGIVFQKYKGKDTLLVAETSRYRLTRIYLTGSKRGYKQIAVDKLDIFPDNLKTSQNGQLWIGSMGMRYQALKYIDENPWTRRILSRLPTRAFSTLLVRNQQFGGAIVNFKKGNKINTVRYCLWDSYPNYKVSSTLNYKNGKLYVSSFFNQGILVIDKANMNLEKQTRGGFTIFKTKPISVQQFGKPFQY